MTSGSARQHRPRPKSGSRIVARRSAPPTTDPPISARDIDRLRLEIGRSWPSAGTGAHLRRKLGQSLEFREYRDYLPGDDIRAVDWRASARRGGHGGAFQTLVSRTFDAEERMTIAVVVDVRAAMRLPVAAPKLLFALWMLRALAQVAGAGGDAVVLGTLFGATDPQPERTRGRAAAGVARGFAERLLAAPEPMLDESPRAHPDALLRLLKPAGAVVLISDMLFDADPADLRRFAVAAQASRRSLVICELDSFEAETALLRRQPVRRLSAVEGRGFGDLPLVLDEDILDRTRGRIAAHHHTLRQDWARGGLVWDPNRSRVVWPANADRDGLAALFRSRFRHLPVVQAIAAGRNR